MIFGLQVIALLFVLVMVYFTYLHYRRRELNGWEALVSLFVWFLAIVVIVFPNFISNYAKEIAISRAFDLAVIGGFIFVIPLVYLSYVKVRRLEKKLEDFTRQEALKGIKNERHSKR